MELGNIARLKNNLLYDYPLASLKEEHFEIQDGYKLSAVVFKRPKGKEKSAKAQIWLISKYGDIIQENLSFEFKFSEEERIQEAIRATSFKVRPEALQRKDAKRIVPEDIVPDFEDVIVERTIPRKTKIKNLWDLTLMIRFSGTDLSYQALIPIDFNDYEKLNRLSLTGTIELNLSNASQFGIEQFDKLIDIVDFKLNNEILRGSPPTIPNKNIIIPADYIRIIKLDYFPPKNVDSKSASLKVEYFHKEKNRIISKLIQIRFSQSIREAASRTIRLILPSEVRYLVKERRTPPIEIQAEDFEYIGTIPGVRIVDTFYDYNEIEEHKRFVKTTLLIEFKTMFFKFNKVLEFAFSKREYINGTFREIRHESDSIIIDSKYLSGTTIKQISKGDRNLKAKMIQTAKISKNYPYSKITDISVSRFIDDSNLVIFAIKANERRGKNIVKHSFEKHIAIPKTYLEEKLMALKPEEIAINTSLLPMCPTPDITERIFNIPSWAVFDSMQYAQPDIGKREMNIQLKLKSGTETIFLEKIVDFKMSINEFHEFERNNWERDYLYNIDPSDITVKIDLEGEPADLITSDDIDGVPSGIGIQVRYKKPKHGEKSTRLYVSLLKGKSKVTFEQTLIFAKAASN